MALNKNLMKEWVLRTDKSCLKVLKYYYPGLNWDTAATRYI
jgi:hypothetical protein